MKTDTKHCNTCQQDKELSEFSRCKRSKDGLQTKCKECDSDYRNKNKGRILSYAKLYRDKNLNRIAAYKERYRKENRQMMIDRYANDPVYRWVIQTRQNLRHILHGEGSHPEALTLLGCTRQEYRDHLESQFTDGMSWENHGEWHVDHIIPVSAFDQTDPEQQKECWNYLNTQPLWAKDNQAKGNKLPTE